MNQKYLTILIVVIFVAAAFIGGYLWRGSDDEASSTDTFVSMTPSAVAQLTPTPTPAAVSAPTLHTVVLTAAGPSPKTLAIRQGDAVRFTNTSTISIWPASDPHPAHTQCPYFDAGRGLQNGEEYTLVFSSATSCTYHSHLDPSNDALRGTIIVR